MKTSAPGGFDLTLRDTVSPVQGSTTNFIPSSTGAGREEER